MDVLVKLTISNPVYQFYKGAADHVLDHTTETLMSDVLTAYAKQLSKDVSNKLTAREDIKKEVP